MRTTGLGLILAPSSRGRGSSILVEKAPCWWRWQQEALAAVAVLKQQPRKSVSSLHLKPCLCCSEDSWTPSPKSKQHHQVSKPIHRLGFKLVTSPTRSHASPWWRPFIFEPSRCWWHLASFPRSFHFSSKWPGELNRYLIGYPDGWKNWVPNEQQTQSGHS